MGRGPVNGGDRQLTSAARDGRGTNVWRRAQAVLLATLLTLFVAGVGGPARAAQSDEATGLANAFAGCAQQRGAADVLLLLDRSQSLKTSDENLVRRDAARDLAQQLSHYADSSGVDLRMQVAGFDGVYHAGPWHPLDPDSLDTVLGEIDDKTSNDGLGPATDYWMALDGARAQFAAAAEDRNACQFLLWFTDGDYDVDENGSFGTSLPYAPGITLSPDTKDDVIAAGKESICSPKKGPMNPMRATGVFVATVGLNANGSADLSFLRQATDGTDGCGRPPEENQTAFLEANEADALTLAIAGLSGGQFQEGTYQGREAALPFGLDDAVSRASVLAYAGPDGGAIDFGLSGPTGPTVWWTAGAPDPQTVSGAEVSFESVSTRSGRFTIPRPASGGSWKGTWTVHLRAAQDLPANSKAQMVVTVTGDLRPVWVDPVPEALIEDGLDLPIELQTGAGEPFTADHAGVRVSIDYLDQRGTSTTLRTGLTTQDLRAPVHVDLPATPGRGRLSLRLDLTTETDPPTQVVPVVTSYDLLLKAAADYPTIGSLTFPSTAGAEPSQGVVPVTGPGCVWLDVDASQQAIASLPDDVESVTITGDAVDKALCVTLEEGRTQDFHVTLTPSAQANGSVVGAVALHATPAGAGSQLDTTVPYTAERTKLEKPVTKWLTLVVVTALGLFLGALPLFVARARLARVQVRNDLGPLQVTRQRFSLVDGRVSGFSVRPEQLTPVHPGTAETVRRLDLDGVAIVPQAFGNPFAVPDSRVTRAGGGRVVTGRSTSADDVARLPLTLTGQWVAWPVGGREFESLAFLTGAEALDSALGSTSRALAERIGSSAAILAAAASAGDEGSAPGSSTPPDGPTDPPEWGATPGGHGAGTPPSEWGTSSTDWGETGGWGGGSDPQSPRTW